MPSDWAIAFVLANAACGLAAPIFEIIRMPVKHNLVSMPAYVLRAVGQIRIGDPCFVSIEPVLSSVQPGTQIPGSRGYLFYQFDGRIDPVA